MTADARSFDVDLDGVRLRARRLPAPDGRRGPVLVFLHDSLGSIALWRDFPERLARAAGLGLLVYDRRGHGASAPLGEGARSARYLHEEAATLARLLEVCGVDDAVLFGHSDGGSIALLAAALHPRGVRAVMTEAAHVFVEEETLAGLRAAREEVHAGRLVPRLARHHGEKAEALAAAWLDTWLSPGFRGWNAEVELRSIRCPVLVLQGERDEYGTEAQVRVIAAGVAGPARTHLFPGLGHTPHREAPGEVVRAAAGFLREIGAAGGTSAG